MHRNSRLRVERLREILNSIAEINLKHIPSDSPDRYEADQLGREAIHELGDLWYLQENKINERRDWIISLLPIVVGGMLMAIVFFWTLRMSAMSKRLTDINTSQNDSIRLIKRRLVDIYHRSSDGLASFDSGKYTSTKRYTDSIFKEIRTIVDSTVISNP
jgi:hypothetical protein